MTLQAVTHIKNQIQVRKQIKMRELLSKEKRITGLKSREMEKPGKKNPKARYVWFRTAPQSSVVATSHMWLWTICNCGYSELGCAECVKYIPNFEDSAEKMMQTILSLIFTLITW